MISLLLAAPLLATVPPTAPPVQDEGQEPPPIQELEDGTYLISFADVEGEGGGMTLKRLVHACQRVTGIQFVYTPETANFLQSTQVTLVGSKIVPKDEFYNFFQILMVIYNFVTTEVGPEPISVIQITSLDTGGRNNIRSDSVFVEPENLEEYKDQPATLITTVISLPNTDVRQLSNSMRTMITDANTQQMLPAGNTNSMVLVGFGSNVVALAKMLMIVDEASKVEPVTPVFEVIPLEYAAADELASTVEELLDASTRVVQQGQRQQPQGATGQLQQGTTEAKIMVDPRTNSLLVMAMPDAMPDIKELVARLDVDVLERERSYHIMNLENVSAEDLAGTLNDFLQDAGRLEAGRQAGQTGQRAGGAQSAGTGTEFVVVPDEQTNSLLIAASRTRFQELKALVERLDRRQDQVLIETALVELSSSDFLDIGVELGLADIPGMGETGGFGVTNFSLSTLSDTDSDGIPDTKVPNTARGITAGILDGDDFSLPLLLRLIEEKQNSNVLNVPSVLVNNNGNATVTTITEQPTTTITATGGLNGQTQENFNGYEEAGITMQISPSISASRYLRLGIFLEVSNFLGTVQGAIPPTRITRTLETSVNVPDGDTMVIGGIIVDNRTQSEEQIPLLGDIPILGRLFERSSSTLDRTALYFFVTPHIMSDESFGDLADYSFRQKLEAANAIGFDRIRLIDDEFSEDVDEIGLSGFDIPLYTPPKRGETTPEEVGLDSPLEVLQELEEGRAELESQDGGEIPPPPAEGSSPEDTGDSDDTENDE